MAIPNATGLSHASLQVITQLAIFWKVHTQPNAGFRGLVASILLVSRIVKDARAFSRFSKVVLNQMEELA